MRRTLSASFALLTTLSIYACAPANGSSDDDDDSSGGTGQGGTSASGGTGQGGTSGAATGGSAGVGATGGAVTGGSGGAGATGGAVGAGGATGGSAGDVGAGGAAAGSAGAGPVMCTNTDKSMLPIDMSGWVARECNERAIQGPWYCYDDKNDRAADSLALSTCVQDVVPYVAGMGLCLTGHTILDTTYKAWGAGIALGLNESGDMGGTTASVKSAYNATMNGVTGFNVVISGDTGGLPLRIGFTTAAPQVGAAPFVEVPGAGSYMVNIVDANVPSTWTTDPNAGLIADPASIYDMQIQVVGASADADYNFCVESVSPITDGSPPVTGTLAPYGSQQCGDFSQINLGSRYMVQNNLYNKGGGSQCVTAAWDNGNNAGFTVNPVSLNIPAGGAPASYPSIVYGWHVDGNMYGGYQTAKQLSAVGSAPTSWTFTVPPSAGRYNASYDVWISNSSAKPGNTGGTLELMVWLAQRDTTPIGSQVGTVMINGTSWVVWYGSHDGFSTVSYVRATNTSSVTGMDLNPFFSDAVTRGYATASAYLLGIQAGFEIWEQNQSMVTNSYSVSVN